MIPDSSYFKYISKMKKTRSQEYMHSHVHSSVLSQWLRYEKHISVCQQINS